MDENDIRVRVPICTPKQVAELAQMPLSTVYSWTRPTANRPALIHRVEPLRRGWPSIPLLGLAEAMVLRPLRNQSMRMTEIAAAVELIRAEGGPFALGSPTLLRQGALALRQHGDQLETLRHGQGVLPLLPEELKPFRLAPDGFIEALVVERLPGTEIDPRFTSGRLRFTKTGVPVFAVAGMLDSGEPPQAVASEYGVDLELIKQVQALRGGSAADAHWLAEVA